MAKSTKLQSHSVTSLCFCFKLAQILMGIKTTPPPISYENEKTPCKIG
ncbi:hypothetical protein RFN66_01400 [Bacillus paralicheniformis]|nr:hypothetical protein [Bacillus paralicheniformis]WMW47706.1 hypothetical protein RFN66_01400 [Bacillus paralicheniformis]